MNRTTLQHRSAAARCILALSLLLPLLATASGCGGGHHDGSGSICGTRQSAPPATYSHVVWIFMENKSYGQIVGSVNAPFMNKLINDCGVATNYHNITHVSLPNYIGSVTGLDLAALQPFIFDCNPGATCLTPAPSLFAQVSSWKAYEESMTMNCQPTGIVGYAVRHNPPVYLTSLSGCDTFDVSYGELAGDLDQNTLPAFSFITPNTVNDMHDGNDSVSIPNGDTWLQDNVTPILNSDSYQRGNTVVFITFDEGNGDMFGEDCAANPDDESCHVVTIVMSPYTPKGTTSDMLFTHYSLLRTTEELLGVSDFLGEAANATSMRDAFHL